MTALVECIGCFGTGVDESGEGVYLCPCCGGSGSMSWREVRRLGAEGRYPAEVRIEQDHLSMLNAAAGATERVTQ